MGSGDGRVVSLSDGDVVVGLVLGGLLIAGFDSFEVDGLGFFMVGGTDPVSALGVLVAVVLGVFVGGAGTGVRRAAGLWVAADRSSVGSASADSGSEALAVGVGVVGLGNGVGEAGGRAAGTNTGAVGRGTTGW